MTPDPTVDTVRRILSTAFRPSNADDQSAFTAAGMAWSELATLYRLVLEAKPGNALEVGMANGTSSVVICAALAARGGGRLVSVDPFQSSDYHNQGVERVRRAGYDGSHFLVEEPNYYALPKLAREGQTFSFIFIDGYHSFDHAFIDIFYSDLLLEDGGILVLHDTDWAAVHKAVLFLERHKPYTRLSPAPALTLHSFAARVRRRFATILAGPAAMAEAHDRRHRWRSLAAYRKLRSEVMPQGIVREF